MIPEDQKNMTTQWWAEVVVTRATAQTRVKLTLVDVGKRLG